jgi:polyribonucleotide nucleotidyltransferase
MKTTVTATVGGKTITIETGRLAKQADGSTLVTVGNNMVLVTAVSSKRESTLDFFPLTVEYQEKFYATGPSVVPRGLSL